MSEYAKFQQEFSGSMDHWKFEIDMLERILDRHESGSEELSKAQYSRVADRLLTLGYIYKEATIYMSDGMSAIAHLREASGEPGADKEVEDTSKFQDRLSRILRRADTDKSSD